MPTKTCSQCHQDKGFEDFYIVKRTGLPGSWCKACYRAKYLAIGESDRMTLKFVKPLK